MFRFIWMSSDIEMIEVSENNKEFLQEEVRCEFKVSIKRKKIWFTQLKMLEVVDQVCQKYNLRYYAANGTLLGAIRHKGFVPWDDDMDISMPRTDYEIFLEKVKEEIDYPFVLEDGYNGKDYFKKQARLRDASTTARTLADWDSNCTHGIFIDIFPMDGSYSNFFRFSLYFLHFQFLDYVMAVYLYYRRENKFNVKKELFLIPATLYVKVMGLERIKAQIRNLQKRLDYDTSEVIQIMTHGTGCIRLPRNCFDGVNRIDFENTTIPVPKGYEELLKEHYGDYMKYPAYEERGKHHSIFFDPDTPYDEYKDILLRDEIEKTVNDY